jgi:hypothetical protein
MELESIREKLVHAFIGGLVAAVLVFFHDALAKATGLRETVLLVVVFLTAFVLLGVLSVRLRDAA